jgi:hypothetical protein
VETGQVRFILDSMMRRDAVILSLPIQPLSIVNAPSFRDLMMYQANRGVAKAKESDIPHKDKMTSLILGTAANLALGLAKEFQVFICLLFYNINYLLFPESLRMLLENRHLRSMAGRLQHQHHTSVLRARISRTTGN